MKQMKKCTLCLREGHLSVADGKCNPHLLLKKCWICKEPGKHHQALCPSGGVGQKPKEKEKKEEKKVPSMSAVSSLEIPDIPSIKENPETHPETPCAGQKFVSMLTANAKIKNPYCSDVMEASVFLDTGSGRTWIRNAFAHQLKLKGEYDETLSVDIFSAGSMQLKTEVVRFRSS